MATKNTKSISKKPTMKSVSKSISAKKVDSKFDLAPMREKIDGLRAEVKALPEGKQKSALMERIEGFYFWAGNYFQGIAKGLGGVGTTASANA